MLRSRSLFRCAVVAVALALPVSVSAMMIDFAGQTHGDIFDPTDYDLTVEQNGSSFHAPVIFDSGTPPASTSDLDLLFGGGWNGGNIAGHDLGNLLILQESGASCGATHCGDSDDSRRGGSFTFEFQQLFSALSFSLVDIDDQEDEEVGSVRLLFRQQGQADVVLADRSFDSFSGIHFGNRSANLFELAALEGLFNTVEINLTSSGAVGELELIPVPEPRTAALLALGLLSLSRRRRRRAAL